MVVKSADHGNDVVVLLFCSFLFLARAILRGSLMKLDVKKLLIVLQKTNIQQFPMVFN